METKSARRETLIVIGCVLALAVLAAFSAPAAVVEDARVNATVTVNLTHDVGKVSPLIYGQFLEHFHRIVYGGVYDPQSPLADKNGFRQDVIEVMRRIHVPILRWPGGCFASAYHWQDGVGENRSSTYDKAWRVEDPNTFGTDEFITICREVGAEPYICGNAGTGTPEELSDWVEYCNLSVGKWARLRQAHGFMEPRRVRYWSIGNENWGGHEIGAKAPDEFARFVAETAKMMRRVDRTIELAAPSLPDADWNKSLLSVAGPYLDYIAIHSYEDPLWENNDPAPYARCVKWSVHPEALITKTHALLRSLGNTHIRVAYDEWNLRGWHHPKFTALVADIGARDANDLNRTYTCADAVYAGCFLNACLRHADIVGMANFAPVVNSRGAIFTHKDGIVLRLTYHVFDLYSNHALPKSVETIVESSLFRAEDTDVPAIDAAMTCSDNGRYALAVINRHEQQSAQLTLILSGATVSETAELWTVTGAQADSFNDVDHHGDVSLTKTDIKWDSKNPACTLQPHSVNMVCFGATRN